jgi:hypothetical protein
MKRIESESEAMLWSPWTPRGNAHRPHRSRNRPDNLSIAETRNRGLSTSKYALQNSYLRVRMVEGARHAVRKRRHTSAFPHLTVLKLASHITSSSPVPVGCGARACIEDTPGPGPDRALTRVPRYRDTGWRCARCARVGRHRM